MIPVKTADIRATVDAPDPVSGFAVPVIVPFTLLVTQTGTPPDESGSGAPKMNVQGPVPEQSPSAVQVVWVSPEQRWLSTTVVLAIGPLTSHEPHEPVLLPWQSSATVIVPLLMTCVFCAMPVQPLSRSA